MVSSAAVGVLALQGAFAPHVRMFAKLHVTAREVRRPEDLHELTHLVLPGGESTTIAHLLELFGLWQPLRERHTAGRLALFGTCAGAILLGRDPRPTLGQDGRPGRLGLADVDLERNAFGRQVDSFSREVCAAPLGRAPRALFIRAPRITRAGAGVRVLARLDGEPIAVEDVGILMTTFHPELGDDPCFHRHFLGGST